MKRSMINGLVLLGVLAVIALSVWGPEALAQYRDKSVLNELHEEKVEEAGEGYRYTLNSNEKVFLLSACLNSQNLPGSEQSVLIRGGEDASYQSVGGAYAFVVNHQGPSGREITEEEIYRVCNEELNAFQKLGILPASIKEAEAGDYEATFYSAIDVLEPRNNLAVWKVSLSEGRKNADKSNRLIDAYIDADSGKIYEFYVRTACGWDDLDPDEIIESWREYLGLGEPAAYENDNPLLETTPYFKKYLFDGMEGERTVVTVGFYEGINELFVKISK